MAWSLLIATTKEVAVIVLRARGVWMLVAGAALLSSLVASSGLTSPAGSSLLLAFGAVVALGLSRQRPR